MANLIVARYFAKRGFENIARIIKRYVDRSPRRSERRDDPNPKLGVNPDSGWEFLAIKWLTARNRNVGGQ